MTIIPLPDTPPPGFFRPLPQAWCYLCSRPAHPPRRDMPCTTYLHPMTPAEAFRRAAQHACEELQLPDGLVNWTPAHIATARGLVQQLQDWISAADYFGSTEAAS